MTWCAAATQLLEQLGPTSVLVNAAAVVSGRRVLDGADEQLAHAVNVNALAHFWTVRAIVPQMLATPDRQGTVVTVSSVMANVPAARLGEYCASKAAVTQMHECLRWELRAEARPHQLRCLLVQPYMIDTPLFRGAPPAPSPPAPHATCFPRRPLFVLPGPRAPLIPVCRLATSLALAHQDG